MSRFSQAVIETFDSILFLLPFLLKKVVVYGHCIMTVPSQLLQQSGGDSVALVIVSLFLHILGSRSPPVRSSETVQL